MVKLTHVHRPCHMVPLVPKISINTQATYGSRSLGRIQPSLTHLLEPLWYSLASTPGYSGGPFWTHFFIEINY